MKKEDAYISKTRLKCELFFIFVLPLILLCTFIRIERSIVYDSSGNFTANSFEIVIDDVNFITNSNPMISLLEYVETSLSISPSNNLVKFINVYNVLWFLMFLIWHLVYSIVDGIVHLVSKSYSSK